MENGNLEIHRNDETWEDSGDSDFGVIVLIVIASLVLAFFFIMPIL